MRVGASNVEDTVKIKVEIYDKDIAIVTHGAIITTVDTTLIQIRRSTR